MAAMFFQPGITPKKKIFLTNPPIIRQNGQDPSRITIENKFYVFHLPINIEIPSIFKDNCLMKCTKFIPDGLFGKATLN